jgi:hypothetical protein
VTHPKPYPRCIFCGDRANSREHAIPKWIAKRLGIKSFLTGFALGDTKVSRKQPMSFASHRRRIFCGGCNEHFKHLEDASIPMLEPMARGEVVRLDPPAQALLALWATKTTIALIAADETTTAQLVPVEHRRAVRYASRVRDDIWVGYFPWRGSPTVAVGGVIGTSHHYPSRRLNAYGVILTFAQLGFEVFGLIDLLPSRLVLQADGPGMRQFSPPLRPVIDWPLPGPAATHDAFSALLNFVPLQSA